MSCETQWTVIKQVQLTSINSAMQLEMYIIFKKLNVTERLTKTIHG